MGIVLDCVGMPVLGPARLVLWLARQTAEAAERELYDEGRLRGELLELQRRLEEGEIPGEEYEREEGALLQRLEHAREQATRPGQGGRR